LGKKDGEPFPDRPPQGAYPLVSRTLTGEKAGEQVGVLKSGTQLVPWVLEARPNSEKGEKKRER